MADDITLNLGAGGSVVATDDITSKHYQIVKLTFGALNSQTIASSGTGTDDAGTQRVTLATDISLPTGPVTNAGTFVVQEDGAALTSLQTIDNIVSVDDAAYTLGSDSGVMIMGFAGTQSVNANDAAALACDTDGALHISDGGNTITVDGTVTANPASGTIDTVTTVGTVTTVTNDVNIADGGNSITVDSGATFTVQEDGALLTSSQLLDDVVVTLGTDTYTETSSKGNVMSAVRNDTLAALANTDNEFAPLQVSATGALHVTDAGAAGGTPNLISTNNTRTSTLGDGATWTATADDVSAYTSVTIQLDASHNSSTDGMTFQFSNDNSNWDDVYSFTYTAADGARRFQFPVTAQYFRNVYTNSSGAAQTHFRVQTILHSNNVLTSIHRLATDMNPDRSAQVVKSVLYAQAAGSGDFTAVDATAGGNLKVSIEEMSNGLDVGNGTVGAETQRITIASDTTGVLSVDDNGGSLTVDGTVAVTGVSTAANQSTEITALQLIDNPIVAHDAAASGSTGVNMAGGIATNSVEGLTQVAAADASRVTTDLNGCIVARNGTTLEELVSERVSNTNGTSTDMTGAFAAGGANVHAYITSVTIHNSHATTMGYVDLRNGAAGGIVWTFPAPATGGTTHNFDPPLKFSANTAVAYDVSAAITTVYISLNGFFAQG